MNAQRHTIGIIGGTGLLGTGLARRWAKAGQSIIIGSRDPDRARTRAAELRAELDGIEVTGGLYADAASAEIVVLTIPFAQHQSIVREIAEAVRGKIVIDCTVPLMPPKVARVQLPPEGSAAKAAQTILGPDVRVVSAFQTVAAAHLADLGHSLDSDVLVCGDDPAARGTVIGLIEAIGMRGLHAGPIDNSAASEALTSALIFINRHYKADGAGVKIAGLADE
jgi:8-hydroxy-5-deazaflavin:NADPH oxidoreductase